MDLGYRLNDYVRYGIRIPVRIELPKKTSNILITGKSGSGKSMSTLYYIWQMTSRCESVCFISDYKAGEEYEAFEGSSSYGSGEDAVKVINQFYDFFSIVRRKRIRLQQHYTLIVEEYSGLLTWLENKDKNLKKELMSKVGELLAVARGLNLGVILAIQRPDATYFSNGARDQFQGIISFGRCTKEQFIMLGFNSELDGNPTSAYRAGQALVLIDGQAEVEEVKVPYIKNFVEMTISTRAKLDLQEDLPSLIRAVAEGNSEGL